jgi:hypothetical protein
MIIAPPNPEPGKLDEALTGDHGRGIERAVTRRVGHGTDHAVPSLKRFIGDCVARCAVMMAMPWRESLRDPQ